MILVRNVFQLKFGMAREAISIWKEGLKISERAGGGRKARVLTDLVGPYYTLVLETQFDSLADWERESKSMMESREWREWYPKFLALAEGGHREIFNIVE